MTMERTARRWLAGLGTATAAGSLVLGAAGTATGVTAGPAARGAAVHAARPAAGPAPGSVYQVTRKTLKFGMRGPAVQALQQRLHFLHYFVGKINGYFGWDTQEAVWAFKEVQTGRIAPAHPNRVDHRTQHALVHPRRPRVLFPHGGSRRLEINKNIEVLVLYVHNKVLLISHVSTAAWRRPDGVGFFTPGGFHRAIHYIAGKVPDNSFGRSFMYWPVLLHRLHLRHPRIPEPEVAQPVLRRAAQAGLPWLRPDPARPVQGPAQASAHRPRRHPDLDLSGGRAGRRARVADQVAAARSPRLAAACTACRGSAAPIVAVPLHCPRPSRN